MSSMKTIPLLLLTLAVYNPCVHGAPALSPPGSPNPSDSDPTPASDPAEAPSATLFFTPAVFLPDYYSQPPPTPVVAAAAPEDDATYFAQEPAPPPAPALDPILSAEPVDTLPTATSTSPMGPPASTGDLASESTLIDDAQMMATSALNGDTATITPAPEAATTVSATSENIPLVFTISEAVTSSTAESQLSSITPTSTATRMSLNPSHSASPTPSGGNRATESSPQTRMSRKAAILGTILAVASLLGISVCAVCVRCRVPRSLKNPVDDIVEPFDPNNKDPEKALEDKKFVSASPTSSQQGSTTALPLPSLTMDAPSAGSRSPQTQDNAQDTQQRADWQTHTANSGRNASGDFDDVTHILSDSTFAPLSGSERSSAVSDTSDASLNRASNGAASVKAASCATAESRYSTVSAASRVGASGSSQIDASDGGASTEYLSLSPASTPSPPESPVLRTPKQGVVAVTRTRSKTLTQSPSPRVKSAISSSKSFPVRLSGGASDIDAVLEEESEWDIAAAYGARFSKGSVGVRSTISEVPGEGQHEYRPEGEHMETIDIGGKHVVMVTGYAF